MRIIRNTSGFSMVEMLLAMSILMIVVAIAFPRIESFIFLGKEKLEAQQMKEIGEAMSRYAKANKLLPEDRSDTPNNRIWAEELAKYSSLSADEIFLDQWGRPRAYVMLQQTTKYRLDSDGFDVHYGAVYGYGSDGCLGNTMASCNIVGNAAHRFDTPDVSLATFSELQAGFGDFITLYSERTDKIEAYEETLFRLEQISEALTTYSERVFNEAIAANTQVVGGKVQITYPPSDYAGYDASAYHQLVRDDANNVLDNGDGSHRVYIENDHPRRKESMVKLMRFLGLPDEYCCSALTVYEDGGDVHEMPFYYFSNPRLKTISGTCLPRPTDMQQKNPARVSTQGQAAACG